MTDKRAIIFTYWLGAVAGALGGYVQDGIGSALITLSAMSIVFAIGYLMYVTVSAPFTFEYEDDDDAAS